MRVRNNKPKIGNYKFVGFNIPIDDYEKLLVLAIKEQGNMSKVVRGAIKRYIEGEEKYASNKKYCTI